MTTGTAVIPVTFGNAWLPWCSSLRGPDTGPSAARFPVRPANRTVSDRWPSSLEKLFLRARAAPSRKAGGHLENRGLCPCLLFAEQQPEKHARQNLQEPMGFTLPCGVSSHHLPLRPAFANELCHARCHNTRGACGTNGQFPHHPMALSP